MKNLKVVYTTNAGYDSSAYFESVLDLDNFARMMANDGRLVRVKVDGVDITGEYVTVIKLN